MRIEPVHYESLAQELVLSDAQQKRADQLYAAYRKKLDELQEKVRQQTREALAEVIVHVEAEGDFDLETFGEEQAARILQAGHRVIRQARSHVDNNLLHFERELKDILTDEQIENWERAWRAVRRDRLLGRTLPENAGYDFHRHPDLIELYQDAIDEDGEFAALHEVGVSQNRQTEKLEPLRRIRDLLHIYEVQLDELLERGRHDRAEAIMQMELAAMRGRMDRVSAHHRRLINSWRQVHQLTRNTAETIAAAASPVLGEQARRRWMMRFWRVYCPDLLAPDSAELMFGWALDLDQLEDDQRKLIELFRNQYEQRRYALWESAVRTRIEIHETQHMLLGNLETILIEGHTPSSLQQVESQRAALAQEASLQLRTVLPSEKVDEFDRRLGETVGSTYDGRLVRY